RAVGPAQSRDEAPIASEVQRRQLPLYLAPVVDIRGDRLHPVVEDLAGNATQRAKRRLVHREQRPQPLVERHVGEHRPAVAQREDEAVELAASLGAFQMPQLTPVYLRLMSRRRLEPAHRYLPSRLPLRLKILLQDRVAA